VGALKIWKYLSLPGFLRNGKGNQMNKFLVTLGLVGFVLATSVLFTHADESVGGKVQDAAGDASTSAKKTTRKAKQKVRKATGTDTVGKDVKDKANDVADDVSNTAKKTDRKLSN
jgi:hypothetical protein